MGKLNWSNHANPEMRDRYGRRLTAPDHRILDGVLPEDFRYYVKRVREIMDEFKRGSFAGDMP